MADILVVPSWYEPFGMVVLKGTIHGLAVVASSVAGPAEILLDGETGLLFPPGNDEAHPRPRLSQAHGRPDRALDAFGRVSLGMASYSAAVTSRTAWRRISATPMRDTAVPRARPRWQIESAAQALFQ